MHTIIYLEKAILYIVVNLLVATTGLAQMRNRCSLGRGKYIANFYTRSVLVAKEQAKGEKTIPSKKRVYVFDTNVLMHDPTALFRFEEHDVCLPITVLEELDNHKNGQSEIARNARQAARFIYQVISKSPTNKDERGAVSYPLSTVDKRARGNLLIRIEEPRGALSSEFDPKKADNQILQVVLFFKSISGDADVILVTKDINMATKARIHGIEVQDYENDKALDDADMLPTGICELPKNFWETMKDIQSAHVAGSDVYTIPEHALPKSLRNAYVNEFMYMNNEKKPFLARVTAHTADALSLRIIRSRNSENGSVFGICALNPSQSFALELLLDPEVDFVTLLGVAGTGKTLLTLAAGLEQAIESELYTHIIFTRITESMGKDIGYLPGNEEEKMNPWMGALNDSLEVLLGDAEDEKEGVFNKGHPAGKASAIDQLKRYIQVRSINFMRGRTFLRKFLVVDEAQNLTPKQMKALITRAGPGTKVVCLGNVGQIDTPYLTEGSSGLTYAVERFRKGDPSMRFGWPHYGHVRLSDSVRSRLASHAEKVM